LDAHTHTRTHGLGDSESREKKEKKVENKTQFQNAMQRKVETKCNRKHCLLKTIPCMPSATESTLSLLKWHSGPVGNGEKRKKSGGTEKKEKIMLKKKSKVPDLSMSRYVAQQQSTCRSRMAVAYLSS
jgi:hypothetical protein